MDGLKCQLDLLFQLSIIIGSISECTLNLPCEYNELLIAQPTTSSTDIVFPYGVGAFQFDPTNDARPDPTTKASNWCGGTTVGAQSGTTERA